MSPVLALSKSECTQGKCNLDLLEERNLRVENAVLY